MAAPLTQEICLHLLGEPLHHPDFEEILMVAEKVGVPIQLTTNGLLIGRYAALLLSRPTIRQINFSLQSYRDNFPNADLDKYLKPIFEFIAGAQETRPLLYINLRLWNTGSDLQSNEELLSRIEKQYQIAINRKTDVAHYKSKKLFGRVYLHFDSRFEWPQPASPLAAEGSVPQAGRCKGLIDHFGIHPDGTVVPCCLDHRAALALGNCFEEELAQILDNLRATKIREGFKHGLLVEELCQKCSFVRRFKKVHCAENDKGKSPNQRATPRPTDGGRPNQGEQTLGGSSPPKQIGE